jgi:hypothetical protein
MAYPLSNEDSEPKIILHAGSNDEMLKITADGFYVRGVKVPVDDNEALEVYNAFRAWMTWAALNNKY